MKIIIHLKPYFNLEGNFHVKLKRLLISYAICMGFVFLSTLFIYIIGQLFNIDINSLTNKVDKKESYYHLFLLILIGPLLEELLFRAFLNFKKETLFISIFLALIFFATDVSYYHLPTKQTFIQITLALFVSSVIFIFSQKNIDKLKHYFGFFLYISILVFALVHIKNFFPLKDEIIWIYPILVLPQFFMGFALAFIRVRNGLIWSIVLHIMINSLPALIMLTSMLSSK